MEPERWQRIELLYHSSLKVGSDERAAFLKHECKDDDELRKEVESLLSYEDAASDFMESPAFAIAAKLAAEDPAIELAGLPADTVVSQRFRIIEKLGTGGMGIVYKSEDTKLRRMVALKFLPIELSRDPKALERFQREAHAASALSHPNICTVHDVDEYQGQPFIAMEMLEGQTLESRIGGQPLPFSELLNLAVQISEGLEAAHTRGIIHRDIKPSNIFVTTRQQCKILDFGLAKLQESDATDEQRLAAARTVANVESLSDLSITRTGIAIGTAGYMSPEQIRGEKLDARTDVFSFGLVLYEMATGRRAFKGDTGTVLHAAILEQKPTSIRELNLTVPAKLEAIIAKALEKTREQRYQNIAEMRSDLQAAKSQITPGNRLSRWMFATTALAVLSIGAISFWLARHGPAAPTFPDIKLEQLTENSPENPVSGGSISPDGKVLAYADLRGMHIKSTANDEVQSIPLPAELQNANLVWEIGPWFPDSKRFLVHSHPAVEKPDEWSPQTSGIWMVSVLGAPLRKVRDHAQAHNVSPDGSWIAFTSTYFQADRWQGERGIWFMAPDGTQPHKLFEKDEKRVLCCLQFFPKEHRVGYVVQGEAIQGTDVPDDVFVTRDVNGGPETSLLHGDWGEGTFLTNGKWLYADKCQQTGIRGDDSCNFWVERFDLRNGKVIEAPRRLTNWFGFALSSISSTADGKHVAFLEGFARGASYVADLGPGGKRLSNLRRVTLEEGGDDAVTDWSVDGKTFIIEHSRGSRYEVSKQPFSGDTPESVVASGAGFAQKSILSPDGKWIILQVFEHADRDLLKTIVPVMRVPFTGGTQEAIFSVREGGVTLCARLPSNLCVVAEIAEDNKTVTVTAFDPVKGRGSELLRAPLGEDNSLGRDHLLLCDLSPDGSRLAIARSPRSPIEIHSLRSEQTITLSTRGLDPMQHLVWAADGKGLFVSTHRQDGGALLHVDLMGKSNLVWRCTGPWTCTANPSPDGRHLAIYEARQNANMFMVENF